MAVIQKNIWGQLSGTIGSTVVRNRNGKSVMYSLPRRCRQTDSDKLMEERNKFHLTVKFAKVINSIPLLKQTLAKSDAAGSNAYQKIIKHIAGKNTSITFTKKNIITPCGAALMIKETVLNNTEIHLTCDIDIRCTDILVIPFYACSVIGLYNPLNNYEIYYRLCGITQIVEDEIPGTEFSITLSPDPEFLNLINNYHDLI